MRLSADAFVTDVLLGELGVAAITTGRDFRFGHKRQGDTDLLAEPRRRGRVAGERGRPGDGRRCGLLLDRRSAPRSPTA